MDQLTKLAYMLHFEFSGACPADTVEPQNTSHLQSQNVGESVTGRASWQCPVQTTNVSYTVSLISLVFCPLICRHGY